MSLIEVMIAWVIISTTLIGFLILQIRFEQDDRDLANHWQALLRLQNSAEQIMGEPCALSNSTIKCSNSQCQITVANLKPLTILKQNFSCLSK